MFIRTIHNRTLRAGGIALTFILIAYILLRYPTALANGVSRGLSICSAVIIPTLYPFMVFAGLLADSPLCTQPPALIGKICQQAFRLPACCGPAILISLIGGYPAGSIAIARLHDSEQISDDDARRMTLFCVNAGPAFIVSTVGAGLLGSPRAGWLLFASHAITSLGMGIVIGRRVKQSPKPSKAAPPPPNARPLATVVQDSCQSLLAMCGFVVFAAAILSIWDASGLPLTLQQFTGIPAARWSAIVAGITEVSCGCVSLAGNNIFAPFWLSLCLGWGGCSVQGQLAAVLGKTKNILTGRFWMARLYHGCISGIIALFLFRFIPAHITTATTPSVTPFYAAPSASIMLLVFSFMAMICFYPKKTGNLK